jgi:(2Fe-2S) ferredoxin
LFLSGHRIFTFILYMSKNLYRVPECVIYTCCGSKCKKNGGKHLYKHLKSRVKAEHLKGAVQVIKTGCTDRCKLGPVVAVMPENAWYLEVSEEKATEIFNIHARRKR